MKVCIDNVSCVKVSLKRALREKNLNYVNNKIVENVEGPD
jgi:hypothetical protein